GRFINTGLLIWNDSFARADGAVIENRGTIRALESIPLRFGSLLRNEAGGTVELVGGGVSGDGRLENAGLLHRTGEGGTLSPGTLLRSLPGSEIRSDASRLDLEPP